MSILISPSDNRGWGAMRPRRMRRHSMRGVGLRRGALTLRTLLGLGTTRRRRRTGRRAVRGGASRRARSNTTTRIVAVRTTSRTSRRRRSR
uniref:PVII protein n=1 Tax=Psittacine aviadenovirus B TaxID=2169709 RepID=A0AB38ZPB4_9ADEN